MTAGSQSLTPADIVKIFQDRVASSQAVETATALGPPRSRRIATNARRQRPWSRRSNVWCRGCSRNLRTPSPSSASRPSRLERRRSPRRPRPSKDARDPRGEAHHGQGAKEGHQGHAAERHHGLDGGSSARTAPVATADRSRPRRRAPDACDAVGTGPARRAEFSLAPLSSSFSRALPGRPKS